jgi:hypothetical protein
MRLEKVNRGFARLAAFQIKRRWFFIAALAGLPKMTTGDNMKDWFDEYAWIALSLYNYESDTDISVLYVDIFNISRPELSDPAPW